MLSLVGLLLAVALLITLAMRGVPILLIAIISTVVVSITSGLNILEVLFGTYMEGYVGFIAKFFFIFLAGALFGKMMDETNGALSISEFIVEKLGDSKALLAVILSCTVLAYGGVSVYVIGFTMYPIARDLFKVADLPRKFLPGTILFGSCTYAMVGPGTPQLQNLVPIATLGTTSMAGSVVGFMTVIATFIIGYLWLSYDVKQAKAAGLGYVEVENSKLSNRVDNGTRPNFVLAVLPLVITIILLNILKLDPVISIMGGVVSGYVLMFNQYELGALVGNFSEGSSGAIQAITNTAAVVGFGTVVKLVPAFQDIVDWVTTLPMTPLIGIAVAVTVICGITGSSTGGIGIAVPIIGPIYMDMGVNAATIHRIAAFSSSALDSLPHNGFIVTLLNICESNHKEGYGTMFKLTVVVPTITTGIAIILFTLFPNLP